MLDGVEGLGRDGWDCRVEVSFLEIYNETVPPRPPARTPTKEMCAG